MATYQFTFTEGEEVRVPFYYKTKNADGTRSPFPMAGKKVSIRFRLRKQFRAPSAPEVLLFLETSQPANALGSALRMVDEAAAEWEFYCSDAQKRQFPKGFGEWEMHIVEADGAPELLAKGPFVVK